MEVLDLLTRIDLLASRKKIEKVSGHENLERLRGFAEKKNHQLQQEYFNYLISGLSFARAYTARIIEKSGDAVFLEPPCNVGQVGIFWEVELQNGQAHTPCVSFPPSSS